MSLTSNSICSIIQAIYDSPVKTSLFSEEENNVHNLTTECPYSVSVQHLSGIKRHIFVQFDSKPEAAALLTSKSYIL